MKKKAKHKKTPALKTKKVFRTILDCPYCDGSFILSEISYLSAPALKRLKRKLNEEKS